MSTDNENRHYNPELDRLHPANRKELIDSPLGTKLTALLMILPELIIAAAIGVLFGPFWGLLVLAIGVAITWYVVSSWS